MGLVLKEFALPLFEMGKILTFGIKKGYKESSWMQVDPSKYIDAMSRHLNEHFKGNLIDPESNELHLSHALVNLAFLVYFEVVKDIKNEKK